MRFTIDTIRPCSCAAVLLLTAGAAADSIRLRASVRLDAGTTRVLLADVAEIQGPEAQRYAELVVLELADAGAVGELSVGQVRSILDDAGAHWGRIDLSGARTIVRGRPVAGTAAPMAMTGASVEVATTAAANGALPDDGWITGAIAAEPTLCGELLRFVAKTLAVPAADVRVRIDAVDETVPTMSTNDYRFEIEPLASLAGERAEVSVRAWREGRVADRWIARVTVERRCEVAVAARDITRGETLAATDARAERLWLSGPAAAATARPDRIAGREAGASMKAGDPMLEARLRKPIVVERGDLVMVRCVVGGLVVSMKAEARAAAGRGDVIELRKLGERETFLAAVSGPGEAIIDLTR